MKTFKQFILEVEEISIEKKGSRYGIKPRYSHEEAAIARGATHISTMTSGHRIYKSPKGNGRVEYSAVHPKTGKTELSVSAEEHRNVLSSLHLGANRGNTLKAHNFYSHLITHHGKILVADAQSPGGHSTWKKLQRYHGKKVGIHAVNKKGEALNYDMHDPEYTHGSSDYDQSPEEKEAAGMRLVAHPK